MRIPKKFKLYNFFLSSSSWRVRIVLNLKQIKYEYIPINILKPEGDQLTSQYTQINPMNQVPTLEVDGNIITESMAICEYLEECVPDPPLLPQDPIKKAQVRAFCEMINAGTQPFTNMRTLKAVEARQVDPQEWAQYWLNSRFASMEKFLLESKGKYCFGDTITLGDAFLLPMVQGTVKRFNINLEMFPNIESVVSSLKDVQEFKDAHPLNQIDAPKSPKPARQQTSARTA